MPEALQNYLTKNLDIAKKNKKQLGLIVFTISKKDINSSTLINKTRTSDENST